MIGDDWGLEGWRPDAASREVLPSSGEERVRVDPIGDGVAVPTGGSAEGGVV